MSLRTLGSEKFNKSKVTVLKTFISYTVNRTLVNNSHMCLNVRLLTYFICLYMYM